MKLYGKAEWLGGLRQAMAVRNPGRGLNELSFDSLCAG